MRIHCRGKPTYSLDRTGRLSQLEIELNCYGGPPCTAHSADTVSSVDSAIGWIVDHVWAFAIITGVAACAIYALLAWTTEWGRRTLARALTWCRKLWKYARSLRITRASTLYRAVGAGSAELPVRTVWVAGSLANGELTDAESLYAHQVAQRLGAELARSNINAVVGESDLLLELCSAFRKSSNMQAAARAIMVHGSLRVDDPVGFLESLLVQPPTHLIVIGGRSRTREEASLALGSNLKVAAFTRSGGAAATLRRAVAIEESEASNAVAACMGWLATSADDPPKAVPIDR